MHPLLASYRPESGGLLSLFCPELSIVKAVTSSWGIVWYSEHCSKKWISGARLDFQLFEFRILFPSQPSLLFLSLGLYSIIAYLSLFSLNLHCAFVFSSDILYLSLSLSLSLSLFYFFFIFSFYFFSFFIISVFYFLLLYFLFSLTLYLHFLLLSRFSMNSKSITAYPVAYSHCTTLPPR